MSFYQEREQSNVNNPQINTNQNNQRSALEINLDESPMPTTRNIDRNNTNPISPTSPIANLTNQMFKRRRN